MASRIDQFVGRYAPLSNFYEYPFLWRGRMWPTAEHAFQAAKTDNQEEAEEIRAASTPSAAKKLGRRCTMRPAWDEERIAAMESVLEAKFSDPHLRRLLLATEDAELVEGNTWGDRFWGVCGGEGRNELGRALMGLRKQLAIVSQTAERK